jgi:rod shape-determining protein MreC
VGYILEPEVFTSKILLLTDRYAAIYAIVQRSRARGIIEGKDGDITSLKYLKREDDIVEGDLVVTSGLDNIFPKGFPIGRVKKATKAQFGMTQDVSVEPIVNPFSLEEVFIIKNAHHTQQYAKANNEAKDTEEDTEEEKSNSDPSNKVKEKNH